MIGAIRLSGSSSARWLRLSSLYLLGTTASGALLGTAVGTLGMVLSVSISLSPPDRMAAGVGLVGLLAVLDLVSRSQWAPGLHRQTDPRWRHQLGPGRAALLWGVELGMGVTTYRITSVFWAALVLVVLIGSPIVGADRAVRPRAHVRTARAGAASGDDRDGGTGEDDHRRPRGTAPAGHARTEP